MQTKLSQNILIGIFVCVLVVALLLWKMPSGTYEGLDLAALPRSRDGQPIMPPVQKTYKSGYLPSEQNPYPLYFQNLLPSLTTERAYHNTIAEDCAGNYGDFQCRQKSYIKTLKGGTQDKTDLMCWRYRDDEDKYYGCMDAIYGDYIWNDRFSGATPCLCEDGSQGALGTDGSCVCPPKRPLHDRRPLDQNYKVVDRLREF